MRTQVFSIIEDIEARRHLFGQYHKMPKINKYPQIIKQAHESNKGYLIGRAIVDYLTENIRIGIGWIYTLTEMSVPNSVLSEGYIKILKEKELLNIRLIYWNI